MDSDRDRRALAILVERGMFSHNFNLSQLVEVSSELAQIAGHGGDGGEWTFVSPHYCYKGPDGGQRVRAD